MDGFDKIRDIPDDVWEKYSDEQQDAYNRRIEAVGEYNETKNLTSPIFLFAIGCVLGFVGIAEMALGILGGFLCFMAIMWAVVKIIDRAHCYQRVRDSENEYNRIMNVK